ncbi:MAG TPA: hypothetical protein VJP79_07665, partial [Nitrososphaera sp.]|nr:hypothetical protein [Nitrososphaera sp.]
MSVMSLLTVAILAASAVSPVYFQPQSASAQSVTVGIATSADSHGRAFFGEGVLQVVVTDPDKDDDDVQETIVVEIDADPESGASVSGSFEIPETSESSGRFEFFLMHDAAALVAIADIDAINTNDAAEYTGANTEAPIIRFGPGEELPVGTSLFEDVVFDITVSDEEITVDYEASSAELQLDRSTYGGDSLVHLFVIDQDANQDPTNVDGFAVTEADLNTRMFDLEGASFAGAATFRETGDNTAIFEAVLQLTGVGSPSSLVGEELVYSEESVQTTLNDLANYLDPSAHENDSLDTSSRSFDIDDEDGSLDEVAVLTFSSELRITLRDNDQNRDSDDDETLDGAVLVALDSIGGDVEFLDMEETDDNSGIFIIDLANNELPVTFLADGQAPVFNNSRLELRQSDINDDILIEYNDP